MDTRDNLNAAGGNLSLDVVALGICKPFHPWKKKIALEQIDKNEMEISAGVESEGLHQSAVCLG